MGWWEMAKPGQEVVCVKAIPNTISGAKSPISVGDVRKIRALSSKGFYGYIFILTDDVHPKDGGECWFNASYFRPVQTKSTDTGMAILKRILERPHQRIEEDA